jgi:hypothetical protein
VALISIPTFIKICQLVLRLNHMDRQIWSALYTLILCTSCKERIKLRFPCYLVTKILTEMLENLLSPISFLDNTSFSCDNGSKIVWAVELNECNLK